MTGPGYFRWFPHITYSNTTVVDITRRDAVTQQSRKNRFAYHPYQLREGQRADFLAEKYYGHPLNTWLVWLSAEVIDPYFGWYLTTDQFNDFMVAKYGSIANSMTSIRHWQLDWSANPEQIFSASDYVAQPEPLKKYFNATFDQNGGILAYRLNRKDWTMSTNMTVTWGIKTPTGNGFIEGERVFLNHNGANVGNSIVVFSNSTLLATQHVFGNTSPTGNSSNNYLRGQTSNATANLIQVDNVVLNMPINELVFFAPVTYYEYETNLNEQRKFINLLDSNYLIQAQGELANSLSANVVI